MEKIFNTWLDKDDKEEEMIDFLKRNLIYFKSSFI